MSNNVPLQNVGHPIVTIRKVGDDKVEIRTTSERIVLEVSEETPIRPTSLAYIVDSLQKVIHNA